MHDRETSVAITEPAVTLSLEAGIARLTLNRPTTSNALDPALAASFRDQTRRIAGDDGVRVVVLASTGRAFCVGGDLAFMAAAGEDVGKALHGMARDLHDGIATLAELDAPVLASVGGVAAGAGMSLVCGADLVIAGSKAQFTMAYTNAGLSPDGGATWFLPRIVGVRRATELMIMNARLSAEEARAEGIVSRVVEADELAAATAAWAEQIAAGPTLAYGGVKRLLRDSAISTLTGQLHAEADSISGLAATRDGREGVNAFLAKCSPSFTGRP